MSWYKRATRQIIISAKDYDRLMELVEKMVSGNKNWTDEELQLQQNYPQALEILLKNRAA